MQKVSIVILNFNGAEDTIACLASLQNIKKSKTLKTEVIVVDNASSDGSLIKIKKKFPGVILLENSQNLGFTGGCNEGARFALKSGTDYVMFLNNDTTVGPDFVEELVDGAKPLNVAGTLPKVYFYKGYEYHKDRYKNNDLGKVIWYAGGDMDWKNLIGKNRGVDEVDHGQYDTKYETNLATGCCFLIKAEVLNKIGLFDDRYFLYYEDADLTERIKRAGYKIIYQPKAVIWHKNAASSGGSGSPLQDYYISRNRLLFGMRYASVRTKVALARESLKNLGSGRLWQKKGIMDFYLRRFGRGSYPI